MNDFDAFILIGGKSSRMGRDKASLLFEGVPMAERIANNIRDAFPEIRMRLVAAGPEQLLSLPDIDFADGFVFDTVTGRGPAGGVYSALANSEKEWALILACDMPLISAGLLKHLAENIGDDIDAVVPVQPDGRPQPLATFYRVRTVRDLIDRLFERPRPTPSMREVLNELRTRLVSSEDLDDAADIFLNVNSEDDVR